MRLLAFENIFKAILLIMIGLFLYLFYQFNNIQIQNKDNGRYQMNFETQDVLDTKTGTVYRRIYNYNLYYQIKKAQ